MTSLDASRSAGQVEWVNRSTLATRRRRRLDAPETEVHRTGRERRRRGTADQRQENTA